MFKRTCSYRVQSPVRLVVPVAMTVVALCAVRDLGRTWRRGALGRGYPEKMARCAGDQGPISRVEA